MIFCGRKKEVRSVILSLFLANRNRKKEVRSEILSSFFGGEAKTETEKRK